MLRRRTLLSLASTVAASVLDCRAQGQPIGRIAFLSSRSQAEAKVHTAAYLRGLKDGGVDDGEARITYQWAAGRYRELPSLAARLLSQNPAVLTAAGDPAAVAAKAATSTVPITFMVGGDPSRMGLASSLNRPGGNATGISLISAELGAKRLQLLCEVIRTGTIGLLVNMSSPVAEAHAAEVRKAAEELKRQLLVLAANSEVEIEAAFERLAGEDAKGLVVQNDPSFDAQRGRLIALAEAHRLPTI